MNNYYRSLPKKPYHLSVGLVIVNDSVQFLSKHFSNFRGTPAELYLFPTETIEVGEAIEETLARALKEEVGMKAEVIGYIGSIVGLLTHNHFPAEKTTIYFLMKYIGNGDAPLYPEEDGKNTIEWYSAEFLREQYLHQPEIFNSPILQEIKILDAAEKYFLSLKNSA
jgi:8-oxo-dGTP pyrophosphatase MutT (NUDIX family)